MEEKLIQEAGFTAEQEAIAKAIVAKEKAALDLWFNRQTKGYRDLWSKKSFSYIDGVITNRIDKYEDVVPILDALEGRLYAKDGYRFENPRVQIFGDVAILTYRLFADTNLMNLQYLCVEIYHKEEDGEWRVVQSTWSFLRPMDMKFS